jgi:prepilin-type N-terminal cleavage/methylation domain-containing protein
VPIPPDVACGSSDARSSQAERSDGFTIIELVVAMGLLAIVVGSLGGVFWAALKTAGTATHRTDAASIASREIESMRAVPYDLVGFYGDETGYTSTFETFTTVKIADTTPAGITPQIQPERPDASAAISFAPDPDPANASAIVEGGVDFTVTRNIVWVNAQDASTTYNQAYKRLTVNVAWTDTAGAHNARQDSLLYPGGQGKYGGPEGAVATTTSPTTAPALPVAPVLATPSVPADPAGETEIDLTWSQATGGATTTSFTVQYSTDSSFPVGNTNAIANLPGSATSYSVTALASSTTYYFKVIAVSGTNQVASNSASATTLSTPVPTCSLGPLTVTGATSLRSTGTILQRAASKMSENLNLGWSTTGTCADTYDVVGTSPSNTTDQGSPYALVSNGSGQYSGSILSSGQRNWAIGVHTFTVWDVTKNKATTAVKTFKVCAFGSSSC